MRLLLLLLLLLRLLLLLLLLRKLLLVDWEDSSVQTLESDLRSVLFGIVDILAVIPIARWNGRALDFDGATPSSTSSTAIRCNLVYGGTKTMCDTMLIQLFLPRANSFSTVHLV